MFYFNYLIYNGPICLYLYIITVLRLISWQMFMLLFFSNMINMQQLFVYETWREET